MKGPARGVLVILMAGLCGALAFWASRLDTTPEIHELAKNAFCVLELPKGKPTASASFTTSRAVDRFHVGARPGAKRQRLSLSVYAGKELLYRGPVTQATNFSLTRNLPPGTYTVTLRQETGNHGGLVVVTAEKPPVHVTGWQILSRTLLGGLLLSGIWTLIARKSRNPRRRAISAYTFQMLLLAVAVLFLYLLFHEGGHALGEILYGRFDFARSDFWGIHGHPHSGGTSGPPLEPWQQAIITGGGPMLPTFAGWAFFLFWASRAGRSMRDRRPVVNLYLSAIVAALIFPSVVVAGCLIGILNDGETQSFISNAPGPGWLVQAILWGVLAANAIILWRVSPELWRAWKKQVRDLSSLPTR